MDAGYLSDVVNYLERNIAKGYSIEGLKLALQNQGYPKTSIDRAITIIEAKRPKTTTVEEVKKEEIIEEEEKENEGLFISFLKKIGFLK